MLNQLVADIVANDYRTAGVLRELTADFTPPEWGCTRFRILFQELEAFETDVLQHIHLEQTVLLGMVNNKLTQTT